MGIPKAEIAGLVLIGGKSERMGRPKALIEFAGEPLWQRAVGCLSPFVSDVILLGSVPGFVAPAGLRQLEDDPPEVGPLGGLVSGLEKSSFQHHLLLAVDYPLVPARFWHEVMRHADSHQAVCGESAYFVEPLVGYYHKDCAPVIREMLGKGELRAHRVYDRVPSYVIPPAEMMKIDPAKWTHFNVNTPADLREAESRIRAGYPK